MRPGLFARLVSSDDRSIDSVIVGGLTVLVALCAIQGWDVVRNHREFNPFTFGGGAAAIIGAIGGAKGWRDRLTPGALQTPPP